MIAGAISATTIELARKVLKTILLHKLRLVSAALLGAGLLVCGASAALVSPGEQAAQAQAKPSSPPAQVGPGRTETAAAPSDAGQAAAETGRWGRLRGRVVYGGEPPTSRIIADPKSGRAGRDQLGGRAALAGSRRLPDFDVIARRGGPIRSERLLVDPETRGVRNALVYLLKPTAVRTESRLAAATTVAFRVDRGVFVPHVLAAIQGAEIVVSTDDPAVYHLLSVIPRSSVFLVEEHDTLREQSRVQSRESLIGPFGNFPDGRQITLRVRPTGNRPRPMLIEDDVQVWMSAWWLILDHPYFAITDERGAFVIHDVPAGPQQVRVWQEAADPSGKVFEGEVEIRGDGETVREYVIERAQVSPRSR
jgi:hypothetical protein